MSHYITKNCYSLIKDYFNPQNYFNSVLQKYIYNVLPEQGRQTFNEVIMML